MNETSTKIAHGGRLVIPAKHRRALGLRTGDEVILRVVDGELASSLPRSLLFLLAPLALHAQSLATGFAHPREPHVGTTNAVAEPPVLVTRIV